MISHCRYITWLNLQSFIAVRWISDLLDHKVSVWSVQNWGVRKVCAGRYLLCIQDRTWDNSSWLRTDQAAFFIHSLEKFHKIQINSNKFSKNSNKLGKIRIKLKQAVSKASWLWPYCCRKEAEWPDVQQCKLPVKKGSRTIWYTTVQTTSQEREQSNLTHNSANYQ